MQFRDSVGLAGCVYGLGDNISARIDGKLYPCVYEDDNSVYFLLPRSASTFHVVGYRANGDASNFPGEYRVTIQTPAPPDEPPGTWSRFQGLRVGPKSAGSVATFRPNSGVLVLPKITSPASRARCSTHVAYAVPHEEASSPSGQ